MCAVIVSGTLERTLTFTLSTQDGTATSPADFSAVSADLTFDESTSKACVDIPVEDDIAVENPENFTVVLSGGDPVIDFIPSTSTVTIIDNDGKSKLQQCPPSPPPPLSLSLSFSLSLSLLTNFHFVSLPL